MNMKPSATVPVIICFGDSLTVGYQSPTPDSFFPRETPYGDFLQERLGPQARVMVSGVCGELTGEMTMRFRRDVLDRMPASVVILGGTNDLGWNAAPAEIMRNLMKMYEGALAAGIKPVAVTVPSVRIEGGPEFDAYVRHRQDLNRLIADYCGRRHVSCVDLFAATVEPETQFLAAMYSNDGLHLTTEGYRRLADLLYQEVFAGTFGRPGRPAG